MKNLTKLDGLVNHFKIILNNFYFILIDNCEEHEKYKKLEEISKEFINFSKKINSKKIKIENIISQY